MFFGVHWRKSSAGGLATPLPVKEKPAPKPELFSEDQLSTYAGILATSHKVLPGRASNDLLDQLSRNEAALRSFHEQSIALDEKANVTPAGTWLLDNFFMLEEQILMARRHLPRGFSRELPRLASGPSKGLPRVYDIALGLISHLDAQVDVESATVFLEEYQRVVPLRLGELWAVPIMLRLSLLEHLRHVSDSLLLSHEHRARADYWVDEMERVGESEPSHVVLVLADMARESVPFSHSFVARFCQRLARKRSALQLAKDWLGQKLDSQGLSLELMVAQDSQSQAENQITVRNSIASLRLLGTTDWKGFVEKVSLVEQVLRSESSGVYPLMDFATRDQYRHAIEAFSNHGRLSELQVAEMTVELADSAAPDPDGDDRDTHVGYYLIDEGCSVLAQIAGVRWLFRTRLELQIKRAPLWPYLGSAVGLTALTVGVFCVHASMAGAGPWLIASLAFTFVVLASQAALDLMNWIVMQFIGPRLLPRMDCTPSAPPECAALVAIPAMLSSEEGVDRLLQRLEIHYLSNRDEFLQFALLTDFRDAPKEVAPGDDELLDRARKGIEQLDARYGTENRRIFHLFHRPRIYNPGEDAWIGRERKRGKLGDLNAVLRGTGAEAFSLIVGGVDLMPPIKYVITLDADTHLPRDAARLLVGSMEHPLNRPVVDPVRGVVVKGYGILQPRVGVSLPSSRISWFVRFMAGESGIDPYTRAVSDAYQDLFGEGTFIGKGIYNVDAFARTLQGRFRDNSILSHDLIESCFSRSGLVSDVELYEAYPSRYDVDIDRRHRWIRGDWQLMWWVMPFVRGPDGKFQANPLSALSRWKILDNLRRSLVPYLTMIFLISGWTLMTGTAGLVGATVVFLLLLHPLVSTIGDLTQRPDDLSLGMHLRLVMRAVGQRTAQLLLTLTFIAYEASMSMDAITRATYRMFVSGRKLLQWKTAGDTEQAPKSNLAAFFRKMWFSPSLALLVALYLAWADLLTLAIASPFLLAWLAAPLVAWWISQPIPARETNLSPDDLTFLRKVARKTWWYFDNFVTADENWLPPDNFQEKPEGVIASRTSPTNIGIAFIANLAAYDLGYLSAGRVIRRTQDTLATVGRLGKHRGHLFNWYDTRSLQPLEPAYVSTVDSGNLAAMLLTLASGLRALPDDRILPTTIYTGLLDTVAVLRSVAGPTSEVSALENLLATPPTTASEFRLLLANINSGAGSFASHEDGAVRSWALNLKSQCDDFTTELSHFAMPQKDDDGFSIPATSLRELAALTSDGTAGLAANAMMRMKLVEELALECEAASRMDWDFLYDNERKLFAIGYNHTEQRMDTSYYDLLASEARLGSYVAIAQGEIDQDHWFSLGRLLVASGRKGIMISWSGSMFEYLMPQLLMPTYEHTLIGQTCEAVVACQIDYGDLRSVPWGVSESGYNRQDAHFTYQYRAFGVPGLGLKRGLGEDLVIAPYASALALIVAPKQACANLKRLAAEGREGAFGFYEAVDYTPTRLPPNKKGATVYSYMAHHQGMSLLALVYLLADKPMQRRFAESPILSAGELLLQERVAGADPGVFSPELEFESISGRKVDEAVVARRFLSPYSSAPEVHLLSNGHYHLAITSAGGGFSRWNGLDVTRWREDPTCDSSGFFIYIRDVDSGKVWSIGHQPTLHATNGYEAIFAQGRAEFRQAHSGLSIHTEIGVSPEDDIEVRRVTITNRSDVTRHVELTSYAEVVMASGASDMAHPAFSNLFVQTTFDPEIDTIFCNRRPRAHTESPPCMIHLAVGLGGVQGEVSCETDRVRFLGRMGSLALPTALQGRARPLSNTTGSVLDPIVSLRRTLELKPGEKASVLYMLGMAPDRQTAEDLSRRYQSPRMAERVFELAWTHSQVTMSQLNTTEAEAQLYGGLASALIYANPACRAKPSILRRNKLGQSALWAYGISGDAPIVLLSISDIAHLEMVIHLVKAHSYWRLKGLSVELIIVNKDVSAYRQTLHDAILGTISLGSGGQMIDKPGGIFLRRHEQIADENLVLLQSVARIVFDAEEGSFSDLVMGSTAPIKHDTKPPQFKPKNRPSRAIPVPPRKLIFENGTGGFTPDGREYVITLQPGQATPMPWVNVIANPFFGTVVSESGGAYTWVENAREFRLTPWNNDPVQDPTGEAFYLRDDETGETWSPTPLPMRGATPYVIRHGFGYTVFEHTENGITSELTIYVAMDAPVKFAVLRVTNVSDRPRQISGTAYVEWVLGDVRGKTQMHVRTEIDTKTGVLLAQNSFNTEFPGRIAFMDANLPVGSCTGDRREFIGRNGSLRRPEGMRHKNFTGKVGAGLDPCGTLMIPITLEPGESRDIRFHIGVGRNLTDVHDLVRRFRVRDAAAAVLDGVHEHWNRVLGTIEIETPDPAADLLANGWLLYQTLSCRLWARTGYFQSGGAYGFRDQLQDSMALVHAEPALVRAHLLRAAAKQFTQGDVLHWWHPPVGRGVRTHFSDDYLWLPYVACHYVTASGDTSVLDEIVPFIEGRPVKPEEDAYFDLPARSDESAPLYQHCVLAIENGLRTGRNGLPLMGGGDWNDGMNRVGEQGSGESVWLAFFLFSVLREFADLADRRGDPQFATRCRDHATALQGNIEKNAWDGNWYLRAFYDCGEPLGSHANLECQIDSLSQSWAVISGAADPQRIGSAMQAVDEHLVMRDAKLIRLFRPAFDKSELDPGYIKGYIPGVRENGGQYTHAAIWVIMALALMGDHERAWELLAMLNPVNHTSTRDDVAVYQTEPYVVAADVYAVAPHTGRGGWTWYTGSASWMYRLIIETLLGIRKEGDTLHLTPRLPKTWESITIRYRFQSATYRIEIRKLANEGPPVLSLNGNLLAGVILPLDGAEQVHEVLLEI
ncbi:MAG: cyclic beta 1-2 glucan synthetase [Candidatus Sumerlaeia bacterium]|nr:cyclic beta 1-2 glucan synthetase [Candidatus Sumerlaeia bacterium]